MKPLLAIALLAAPSIAQAPYVHRLDKLDKWTPPNGVGLAPSVSSDGRFVTYLHTATDLTPGGPPGLPLGEAELHLYRHDMRSGMRLQVDLDGAGGCLPIQAGPHASPPGAMTADGHTVAFVSKTPAPHLGDSDATADIFLRDVKAGTTEWLSTTTFGAVPQPSHVDPSLSGDGRFVVHLTQLEPWAKSTGAFDGLVLVDRELGTRALVDRLEYPLESVFKAGYQRQPLISADGSTIACMVPEADGTNLYHLRLLDVASGVRTDVPLVANTNAKRGTFALDADATQVAFESHLGLVASDTDSAHDIYTYDLATGAVALRSQCAGDGLALRPALSPDGRYLAFQGGCFSDGDLTHVQVVDLATGLVTLESINDLAVPGTSDGFAQFAHLGGAASLSNLGAHIVFHSTFSNLAAPAGSTGTDAEIVTGVFVRERGTDGPQLDVTNLFAGKLAKVRIEGATPGAMVLLGMSIEGPGPFPSYWGLVHLTPPLTVWPLTADGGGLVEIFDVVPLALLGKQIWMQGVDLVGNRATTPFTAPVR